MAAANPPNLVEVVGLFDEGVRVPLVSRYLYGPLANCWLPRLGLLAAIGISPLAAICDYPETANFVTERD